MNFVLQLSYSDTDTDSGNENEIENECDPEEWRKGEQLVKEGYTTFPTRFGSKAFALHHRFYLRYDTQNRVWLSAEDGCEGYPDSTTPSSSGIDGVVKRISSLMNL